MIANTRKQKRLTRLLFIIYLLVLIWIIVFKFSFTFEDIPSLRSVNLIPLEGTAIRDNQYDYNELLSNVIIFMPFGLYIGILKRKWRFLLQLLPIFGVSLLFESLQYIFAIGATDITDLIGNTLGGALGIITCFILRKAFNSHAIKVLNIIAVIGTIAIFSLFALLMATNV